MSILLLKGHAVIPVTGLPISQTLVEVQRKEAAETAETSRGAQKIRKRKGWIHPVTRGKCWVGDTMESRRFGLCRLISPFSARPLFLPLISSAFRERETLPLSRLPLSLSFLLFSPNVSVSLLTLGLGPFQ